MPQFGGEKLGRAMVEAMVHRGPHVRFVWTVCCDDALDHHPDRGLRAGWHQGVSQGWLRVERQVTVPLPDVQAALFLIRTSLTRFDELSPTQRQTLSTALEVMPPDIAAYKGLAGVSGIARRLLSG